MIDRFKKDESGWLYFYIHFVTEVACFYVLGNYVRDGILFWLLPFVYDMLAFVPQGLIGFICDKFKKLPITPIGIGLMALGVLLSQIVKNPFVSLVPLCLGNGCTHVGGAEVTLRAAEGRLSPSAIFVSGGSFGVITGRLLQKSIVPFWGIILFLCSAIPFAVLAQYARLEADAQQKTPCESFAYHNSQRSPVMVIVFAVFIVMIRGYMGYGIPTSWNKTMMQTVALFVVMGLGKALGGIVADAIGVRKTALLSASLALPFLMCGDKIMAVSLVGVLLFSMTMSITLVLLVSVLPDSPGVAFGCTTLGLFLGVAPVFIFRFTSVATNCIVISVLTVICLLAMHIVLGKDQRNA